MPTSPLSLTSTQDFRKLLLSKNLSPYSVPGVYTPTVGTLNTGVVFSYHSVINSPDDLISGNKQANLLYVNNSYGPSGGFNGKVNVIKIQSNKKLSQPYWGPPSFLPSQYTPYNILLGNDPQGNNGQLSQDSFIARLGAEQLKFSFQETINANIFKNTVGRVNLQSLQDPFQASLLVTGQQPLVYKNWMITVPENPILRTTDFLTRLAGAYWPVSPIPGDYFNENEKNGIETSQTSTALNVINQLTGGFLAPILNIKRNPSQIFLGNTGNGQRSVLFSNLDSNRYRPAYDKNYGGLLGVAQGLVNLAVNLINPNNGTLVGGYYVGSKNSEPSQITSPPNQIPVNPYGKQIQAPVYGPSELGILYEGNQDKLNFGLAAKSYGDGGGIDGQFVWVSPKYKGNAGFKVTPGGGAGSLDSEYNLISSSYEKNESTNIEFKENSILDQTQRLINSADNVAGISKLKHVGNAINQVSKVFNDGYKEMTKGSQVLSYTDNTTGGQAGIEYCRVFTKDTPYYTYADLQKTDGITTSGRRFTNSVLDNTFNLNIVPYRNPGSTNIVKNSKGNLHAKKYMFSIENLAWRTSSKPGYTYDELPASERGPNGGRVMWFPPYDLKFNDGSTANWNSTSFLGRPEPIYTYKDTRRSGSVSWKIIVDSPSVMNLIVEKQLKGQNKERINSIIDSFFAGCVKYDIYELASKFTTIPTSDLYTYQTILNNPNINNDVLNQVNKEIPKDNSTGASPSPGDNSKQEVVTDALIDKFKTDYNGLSLYFDNDEPNPNSNATTTNVEYETTYFEYTSGVNINKYIQTAKAIFDKTDINYNVEEFFNNIVFTGYDKMVNGDSNFITDAYNILSEKKGKMVITMKGAASASASVNYNDNLSERRIDSVRKFLQNKEVGGKTLKTFFDDGTIKVNSKPRGEQDNSVVPTNYKTKDTGVLVECTEDIKDKDKKVTRNSQKYSTSAMACRRVYFEITIDPTPVTKPIDEPVKEVVSDTINSQFSKPQPTTSVIKQIKEGISKKIVRQLLNESDYFEIIKEENPMIYDSIKEKIKYFSPSFHSMTPEGLNSRLTFLNQCVRPGETIPVIGVDGKPKYNDAVNTSFGAPPVLVLRIGDFYNTKIIPNNISFTYEPLVYDINPEGIGVQPMIANVTMSFDFIGGSGLAGPIDELQNALSFNYYGNTEIYDERATATEDTSSLDAKMVQSVLDRQPSTTVNNVTNQATNNGGNTIGDITSTIIIPSGQTGDITYQKMMDKLLDDSKTYFTNVVNQLETMVKTYNYGVLELVNNKRNYSEGTMVIAGLSSYKGRIYGKPDEYQGSLEELFNQNIEDIQFKNNPIITKMVTDYKFNDTDIRTIQDNMTNYILNELKPSFNNGVGQIIQTIVTQEQDYIQDIRKINIINDKTDGKIIDKGIPSIYNISGTTQVSKTSKPVPSDTYVELYNDYQKCYEALDTFSTLLTEQNIANTNGYTGIGNFQPVSKKFVGGNDGATPEKRFFMIIARIFNDKNNLEKFKNSVIKGGLLNVKSPYNLKKKFDNIVDDLANNYNDELSGEEKKFKKFKESSEYRKYTDGIENTLYPKGKIRVFNYTTIPDTTKETQQKQKVQDLYKIVNVNEDKTTFDGKVKLN
jgi:hypothetical protein